MATIQAKLLIVGGILAILALQASAVWYYRTENGQLEAELVQARQDIDALRMNAENMRAAVTEWMRDQEQIAAASKETRDVIRRSYRNANNSPGYFPADVFKRLRDRAHPAGTP